MKIPKSPSLGYYFFKGLLNPCLSLFFFFGIDLILIFHFSFAKTKRTIPQITKRNDIISHELPQQQIQSILMKLRKKKNIKNI